MAETRPTRPYRPSNGTEGEGFTGHWCDRCLRDRAVRVHQDYENGCDILARALMFRGDDPNYPVEWQQYTDEPWEAFCTAFIEDDHDDDWESPAPPDPNQFVLLADPTEDAATIQSAPVEIEEAVGVTLSDYGDTSTAAGLATPQSGGRE